MTMVGRPPRLAGVCGLLSAHEAHGASSEWWRLVLGRLLAFARHYAAEFALETVELVVEGNDVAPSVRHAVFEPLHQVQTFCG